MFRAPGARPALLAAALSALALPAGAGETKIAVREDGVKVIFNEPAASRERRYADVLRPIPFSAMAEAIERHASDRALDPKLVRAVIQAESGYNVEALSNKGAMGLMQLMPGTARLMGVADPWDYDQNIAGGTRYLRQLLDRFADQDLAVAAYNAGPEAVAKYSGIPPYAETREYVRRVRKLFDGTEVSGLPAREGRPVSIVRDANNRILLTTASVGRQ
jgi:soluble lytic murein transglycosylase-like protein